MKREDKMALMLGILLLVALVAAWEYGDSVIGSFVGFLFGMYYMKYKDIDDDKLHDRKKA